MSGWLLLGILALAPIFAWFTLRRGYSNGVRTGALLYMAMGILLGLLGAPR
ncbi:hypothetical protein [Sphingomonas sp.]|uniref:hypothetical protein n=1 Tax=Sphingomonas sp. TaxID=28214 RepID=UPI003B3A4465